MPNTLAPEAIVTTRLGSAVPTTVASPVTLETTPGVPMLPISVIVTVGATVSMLKLAIAEVPVLPAASVCAAVIDLLPP